MRRGCKKAAKADEKVARMLAIRRAARGLYSNASTHAAGVVISDRPLIELAPALPRSKSAMPATSST